MEFLNPVSFLTRMDILPANVVPICSKQLQKPVGFDTNRCLLTKANARWVVLDRAPKPATSPPTTFPLSLPPPSLLGTTEFP
ncbi:hypothetical protein V1478_000315 [Vespula squamosa]|uniref:Uncharacterized protein n=1 Tax=Vespula squamosa TaxID=30214 RepID=A0ABD2C608_VESSQ